MLDQNFQEFRKAETRKWVGNLPDGWKLVRHQGLFDETKTIGHADEELLSVTIERASFHRQKSRLRRTLPTRISPSTNCLNRAIWPTIKCGCGREQLDGQTIVGSSVPPMSLSDHVIQSILGTSITCTERTVSSPRRIEIPMGCVMI